MKNIWNVMREIRWITVLALVLVLLAAVNVFIGHPLEALAIAVIALVFVEIDKD